MRIILTAVGLSLVDKIDNLAAWVDQTRAGTSFSAVDTKTVHQRLTNLKNDLAGLGRRKGPFAAADLGNHAAFPWVQRRWPGAGYLVDLLCALWRLDQVADPTKRLDSPAELASLSLLTPKLTADDEVRLLFSESLDGALCSAILAETLTRLSVTAPTVNTTSTLGQPGCAVEQELLAGVQIYDADRLSTLGMQRWAVTIDQAQARAGRAADRVLLNITGGYKGLAPLSTLLAFGLSETSKPIDVVYLYEESDQLFALPGSGLIQFDLSIFRHFERDWDQFPADGLDWPACEALLTARFIEQVIKKRPDLFTSAEAQVQLTVTGRILFSVWQVRRTKTPNSPPPTKV